MNEPESKTVEEAATRAALSVVPITSTEGDALTGVPNEENLLPDLVLNRDEIANVEPVNTEQSSKTADVVSTEEDLKPASTLLSLGDIQNGTLDDKDKNEQLMPIGGANALIDAAPEPLMSRVD